MKTLLTKMSTRSILLITSVHILLSCIVTIVKAAAVTTAAAQCPYADPFVYGISCLHKGFSKVLYRPIHDGSQTTPNPLNPKGPEPLRAEANPNIPPPSTPDLSREFMEFYCSDQGQAMLDCTKNLTSKCSQHHRLKDLSFNQEQAVLARELCDQVNEGFVRVVGCLNKTVHTSGYMMCAENAYYDYTRQTSDFKNAKCRAVAETYNCYTEYGYQFCNQTDINFSIALMRVMEDQHCTLIVTEVYEPQRFVSKASSLQGSMLYYLIFHAIYVLLKKC